MPKEVCSLEVESNPCYSRKKNESCLLFQACSALSNNGNGDLTPTQFTKKYPELRIEQIVGIAIDIKTLNDQDRAPLNTLNDMILSGNFVIANTETCVFEGKSGRRKKCQNKPGENRQHMPIVCKRCFSYPGIAR
ncbi:MAG: hypothetical protein HW400_414 [Candidatus Levybacteria bacterium]|nr:hypothetical protein [Candidatus Levybacteria bacterium]